MRRTLEDIIPPSRRRAAATSEHSQEMPSRQSTQATRSPRHRFAYTPALIAIVIIVIAAGILFSLSGSQIKIDPMTASAHLDGIFAANASTTSSFPFAVVSVEKLATQTVAGKKGSVVHTYSQGMMTVYNTQKRVQRLVTKTRFETKTGLVFRIHKSVSIPAAHGIIPGILTVPVFADASGAQYNVGPSNFTLPGLAGSSLARKVYGRSSKSMTGGFSGAREQVSPAVEVATRASMRSALSQDLANSIKTQVPADYVLLRGSATTTYSSLPNKTTITANKAVMSEKGILTAVIFPKAALAKAVARAVSGTYSGQPVSLLETKSITLIPANTLPSSQDKSFYFTLSGSTTVVWTVNPSRVATAVAGKTLDQARTIIKGFPEIKEGFITLRPFWKSTLPNDPSKISVVVTQPKVGVGN